MFIKQGWFMSFLQNFKQTYFVSKDLIKIRCSNTVFNVYLRKLFPNWGKFLSTVQVLSNILHTQKMNWINTSHFYAISRDQNLCLAICQS